MQLRSALKRLGSDRLRFTLSDDRGLWPLSSGPEEEEHPHYEHDDRSPDADRFGDWGWGLSRAERCNSPVVRVATRVEVEVIGFHHGWRGVVEGDASPLTTNETKGILQLGGTVLHTARYHPDQHEGGTRLVLRTIEQERLDGLIVLGGDGTLGSASRLGELGVPVIGIPKTIDNDVAGTTCCIGFDTAVATAAEAIDRVYTTGESHDRLMIVEVMGRTTGWLAVCAGIAAGADAICLPEASTDLDELAKAIQRRHDAGSSSSVVVVAEGAHLQGTQPALHESTGMSVMMGLASGPGTRPD